MIAAAAIIPIVILLVNTQLAREFAHSRTLALEVSRSYQTRVQLDAVLTAHHEMEAGQRGFVLTGDPAFLERYEAERQDIGNDLRRLTELAGTGSEVAAGIPALTEASDRKLAFMSRTVALVRQGNRGEAARLVATGNGRALMEALRVRIDRLEQAELAALRRRSMEAEQARVGTQRTAFALQTLLVLLLLAAAWTIRRNLKAKREALERYRALSARQEAIYDSARDGMLIHDAQGIIESMNPAATRIYGYSREELIGRNVGILFETPPTQAEVEQFLMRLTTRRRDEMGRVTEFAGRRRDGSIFPADVATSPVHLGDKQRFLAVIRDISDRKAVEQMKGDFVSTVSHELRTPLTSIAGSLGLLSGGAAGALPERAVRLVEIAHSNSERLVRLINDILDIEKMESGKMSLDLRHLALGPLLQQAVQANRPYAIGFGVELVLALVPGEAWAVGDADRLTQVVTNLISNAVKYSPAGEAVIVSLTPHDGHHRVTVADRGPGIPDEFRDRIFERFAQADSSDTRQRGGTGLGLAIVREIVARHQGQVSFDSVAGEGTAFHVDLPVAHRGIAPAPERRRPLRESRGEPLQILHVDDDVDMLRIVASVFEGQAQVHSTPSLDEARASLLRRHFDAAILDIEMEGGSGLDLLPLVKDGDRPIPAVLFTARDPSPELEAMADAVLTKSKSGLDELVATVMRLVLSGHRRKRAAGQRS